MATFTTRAEVDAAIAHGPFADFIKQPVLAYINGRNVPALSGKTMPSENPATGETICHVAECDAADVDVGMAWHGTPAFVV